MLRATCRNTCRDIGNRRIYFFSGSTRFFARGARVKCFHIEEEARNVNNTLRGFKKLIVAVEHWHAFTDINALLTIPIAGLVGALFALPTALIVFRLRGAYSAIDNAFVKYEQDHSRTSLSELLASEDSGRRSRSHEIGTTPDDQWEAKT
jgi:ABC-type branched-subunit amino acid transport system permease subunit